MPELTSPEGLAASQSFLWRAIQKHWILGVASLLAVVLASGFYTMGQRRIYEASARILIDPDPPRPLGKQVQAVVDVGNGSYWGNKEYLQTQTKILAGASMSRETARVLGLERDTAFIANMPPGQKPKSDVHAVSLDEAGAIVNSRLKVEPMRDSRLVDVSMSDADAERARRILSTLLDIFLENNVERAVRSTVAASEWLNGQTGKLKSELELSELALHEYKKDKQILSVSLDDQSNMLRGEMQQLTEAITRVKAKREELKGRLQQIENVSPDDPTSLNAPEFLSSSVLSSFRQNYIAARNELGSVLSLGRGPNHPEAVAAASRVEITKGALTDEIRNIQGALRSELASATHEGEGLDTLLNRAKQRAFELNMLEIEYRRLERAKDNTEKLYGLVVERAKESELTGMLRFNNIRVAEIPSAGRRPVSPRVPLNLALGLGFGLILGVGVVLARARLDQTLRFPNELEAELGAPLLGVVPSFSSGSSRVGYYSRRSRLVQSSGNKPKMPDQMSPELLVHALPSSHVAECIRVIRTSLTFASPDKPYKRILITSGNPAEGKTTIAVSLATAFAQAGQKVLLVDADLRRARMHRIFGCSNADGVSTALQSDVAMARALVATAVPNLTLLAGGPHVPNPAELIQSASFERMLKTLEEQFDRIVIDSPPVLAVADAAILATLADVALLIVRAGVSRLDLTRQAMRKLDAVGKSFGGIILNALQPPRWGRRQQYYYYYYGTKTGSYGGTYGNPNEA